jgi:hypothetical protein
MALPSYFFHSILQGTVLAATPTDVATGAVTTYAVSGMRCDGSASEALEFTLGAGFTAGWVHFHMECNVAGAGTPAAAFRLTGGSTDLFRLRHTNSSEHMNLEYWDGSAWQVSGSTVTTLGTTVHRFDIYFSLADSGGEVTVYVDGASTFTMSGDTLRTAETKITSIKFGTPNTAGTDYAIFGRVVVDANDTRNLIIDEQTTSVIGGETGWTGAEADIDEKVGAYDTANSLSAASANIKATFTYASVHTDLNAYTVDGVVLAVIGKADADPGFYVESIGRVSSVTYENNDSQQFASSAWLPYNWSMPNSPATGAAWANVAAVNAMELGWKTNATP